VQSGLWWKVSVIQISNVLHLQHYPIHWDPCGISINSRA
jgi:hypothetical protein